MARVGHGRNDSAGEDGADSSPGRVIGGSHGGKSHERTEAVLGESQSIADVDQERTVFVAGVSDYAIDADDGGGDGGGAHGATIFVCALFVIQADRGLLAVAEAYLHGASAHCRVSEARGSLDFAEVFYVSVWALDGCEAVDAGEGRED